MIVRVVVCLIILAFAPSIFAQGTEVSGGYAFLREDTGQNRHGFVASSIAKNLSNRYQHSAGPISRAPEIVILTLMPHS